MQDLIERLRERSNYNLAHCDCDKCLDGPCVRCLDAAVQSEAAEALTTAQAEIEALRELLGECQDKLGDIVMGEGLHPDDAAVLHAKIAALSGSQT